MLGGVGKPYWLARGVWRPYWLARRVWRPSWTARSGHEALPDRQEELEALQKGLGGVGSPSWWPGGVTRDWKAFLEGLLGVRSRSWRARRVREALPESWEGSGEWGEVGSLSWSARRGWESSQEGQKGSGSSPEGRVGSAVPPGGLGRVRRPSQRAGWGQESSQEGQEDWEALQ